MTNKAIIQLEAGEARAAKLAASKEGMDKDCEVVEELGRAFSDEDDRDREDEMRFEAPPTEIKEVSEKCAYHSLYRKNKNQIAAGDKYMSISGKIQHQLMMQGVVVE